MLRPVTAHEVVHLLSEPFFVFKQLHINKVYNYNTADIPQPKLPRNFLRCLDIILKGILLLVIAYAFIAAIYINNMQSLSMLDNKISPAWQVNRFSERSFYLPGDSITVKNGCAIIMKRKYF